MNADKRIFSRPFHTYRRSSAFIGGLLLALVFSIPASGQSENLPPRPPGKPLALVQGRQLRLAWSLGDGPRPHAVAVYRASSEGDRFEQVAELEASVRAWTDDRVIMGRTYIYQVEALRGGLRSGPSQPTEVLAGTGARVMLRGGSPARAVFEVTLYSEGRKLSAIFSHGAGEKIGDLVYVNDLQKVIDFRLGATLRELNLTRAYAPTVQRETLFDPAGAAMTDLAGMPIAMDFRVPDAEREVLSATIELPGGRFVPLLEGAELDLP